MDRYKTVNFSTLQLSHSHCHACAFLLTTKWFARYSYKRDELTGGILHHQLLLQLVDDVNCSSRSAAAAVAAAMRLSTSGHQSLALQ